MKLPTYISEISQNIYNENINLKGWVKSKSETKSFIFINLRDGTGYCQCFIKKNDSNVDIINKVKLLTLESSVSILGTVQMNHKQLKGYEIYIKNIVIYQICNNFPITKKKHGINFLLSKRHLWLRSQRQWATMKIKSNIFLGLHKFLDEKGFVYVNTPILTNNSVENTTSLFKTGFYNVNAYLSQSGQLYGEAAAMSMNKIYTLGPNFRAEKSKTRRHLSEFWMLEPEMAFYDLNMTMDLMEELIIYIINYIIKNNSTELSLLNRDIDVLKSFTKPFNRITYKEAIILLNGHKNINSKNIIDLLNKDILLFKERQNEISEYIKEYQLLINNDNTSKKDKNDLINKLNNLQKEYKDIVQNINNVHIWIKSAKRFKYGNDLGGADETSLMKLFNTPLMIYHWPYEIKPFYMKKNNYNKNVVNNVDLLAPEGYGEIIGGSEREDDFNQLITNIKNNNLNVEDFKWYLDLRQYGTIPHSGFGLGIERITNWICKSEHVRETATFPRMYGNITP